MQKSCQLSEVVDALGILGSAKRLKLLSVMHEGPQTPLELAEKSDEPLRVWYHLQMLLRGGLVKREGQGKEVYYSLCPERLECVIKTLINLRDDTPNLFNDQLS